MSKQFCLSHRLVQVGLMVVKNNKVVPAPGLSATAIRNAAQGLMEGKIVMTNRDRDGGEVVDITVFTP